MRPIHFLLIAGIFFLINVVACNETSCENTLCENGGVCHDGTCDCPDGFTGTYCRERATPDKIRINSLAVTRFPGLNGDGSWDNPDGPDIFFKLYDDTIPIAKPIALIENADATRDYSFLIFTTELNHITGPHTLQLLDYDGFNITPEFMGEVKFIPSDKMNGLPETIILDDGGPVAFVITVTYVYEKKILD